MIVFKCLYSLFSVARASSPSCYVVSPHQLQQIKDFQEGRDQDRFPGEELRRKGDWQSALKAVEWGESAEGTGRGEKLTLLMGGLLAGWCPLLLLC